MIGLPEKGRGERGGFFIWRHWAAFYALLPDIVPHEILGTAHGLTNTIRFASLFCVFGGILIIAKRQKRILGKGGEEELNAEVGRLDMFITE